MKHRAELVIHAEPPRRKKKYHTTVTTSTARKAEQTGLQVSWNRMPAPRILRRS